MARLFRLSIRIHTLPVDSACSRGNGHYALTGSVTYQEMNRLAVDREELRQEREAVHAARLLYDEPELQHQPRKSSDGMCSSLRVVFSIGV